MKCLVVGRGPWGRVIGKTISSLGHSPYLAGRDDWKTHNRVNAADAVFVATPASQHFEVVEAALRARKPVFCEKPFVLDYGSATFLRSVWADYGRPILLVDHIQLFNTRLTSLKRSLDTIRLDAISIDARGWGPFRTDCSGLWDWGSHAVAEAMYLTDDLNPGILRAKRIGRFHDDQKNVGDVFRVEALFGGVAVTMEVGNGSPERVRRGILDFGSDLSIGYDASSSTTPPLTNAISAFFTAIEKPDGFRWDVRFGPELPVAVTKFLADVEQKIERRIK